MRTPGLAEGVVTSPVSGACGSQHVPAVVDLPKFRRHEQRSPTGSGLTFYYAAVQSVEVLERIETKHRSSPPYFFSGHALGPAAGARRRRRDFG
jgi:hypothetical protein